MDVDVGIGVAVVGAILRPVATHRFPVHWTSLAPPANNVSFPTYTTLFPPVVKRGRVVAEDEPPSALNWTLGDDQLTPPSVLILNEVAADRPVATT